jgi:hypothetical protein
MKKTKCIIVIIIIALISVETRTVTSKFRFNERLYRAQESSQKIVKCSELPAPVLNEILGPAFNSRYGKFSWR